MVKITVWGVSVIYSCVRGEAENAVFEQSKFSVFVGVPAENF